MPSMMSPRLTVVLKAHEMLLQAALAAATLDFNGHVQVELPAENELVAIKTGTFGKAKNISVIVALQAVEPSGNGDKSITSRVLGIQQGAVSLFAQMEGTTATFEGAITAGLNIHAIVGQPAQDVYFQTNSTDALGTMAQLATKLANLIIAAGISVQTSGASLTVDSALFHLNIGGTLTRILDVGAVNQRMQITIYTSNDTQRDLVCQIIDNTLGTRQQPKIPLPDGTLVWTRFLNGPMWSDETVVNSMLKRADMFYMVQYARLKYEVLTQVGSFKVTQTLPNGNSLVSVEG